MTRLDPALPLRDPDGEPRVLADLATDRFLVVQLVRYFGCLPCQDWLIQLDRGTAELAARHATPAAIGGSADYQARWLRDDRGVAMPLRLDPDHLLRDAVGMAAPLGLRMADPRGIASYAASLAKGNRMQKITKDTVRTPGVIILDSDLTVPWRHEGARIGDYPDHGTVLAALEALV